MSKKILLTLAVFALFTSRVAIAGPAGLVGEAVGAALGEVIKKASEPAVAITNSITGGVTSHDGGVEAKGRVSGEVSNTADGDDSTAKLNVGSNTKTTAKKDIKADGFVGGKITNRANGKGATATTLIGGNGQ